MRKWPKKYFVNALALGQGHLDGLVHLRRRHLLQLESVGDIVPHGQVGEERVGLEDHGHRASVGWNDCHVLAVEHHLSK